MTLRSLHSALNGVNSTVFTYGMTGSGKTFTMLGATDAYEKRGLIPVAWAIDLYPAMRMLQRRLP